MHAWALGAGGAPVLKQMLEITEFEIETTMKLLGVTSLAQLNTSFLRDVDASVCTGAFPLLGVVSTGERAPVL
jgi:isopentenyl diphosphate isomerase/L-lactate dehydrogenase-like FMN-dependent dehydrogenase